MTKLGSCYHAAGRPTLAIPLLEDAFKLRKAKLGPYHDDTLISMNFLAICYRSIGKLDLALPLYLETVKILKDKRGPEHLETVASMNNLATCYLAAGKTDLALPLFEETLKLRNAELGPDDPATLDSLQNLASARLAAGQSAKAIPLFTDLLARQRKRFAVNDPRYDGLLITVSRDLLKAGEFPEAEKLLRECLSIRQKNYPEVWQTFETQSLLGSALFGQKKYADAEPLLWGGYHGLKQREAKIPPSGKVRLTEAEGRLAELFDATSKKDETRVQGKLTDAKTDAFHEVKLVAGSPVILVMQSKQFDTLLRLHDAKDNKLAENDDIDLANKNTNSRILFIPKEDGVYRIIATSFQQTGRGEYEIIIRQYMPTKSK
jgi:tetratricopeptide (TPR) repeat protein